MATLERRVLKLFSTYNSVTLRHVAQVTGTEALAERVLLDLQCRCFVRRSGLNQWQRTRRTSKAVRL